MAIHIKNQKNANHPHLKPSPFQARNANKKVIRISLQTRIIRSNQHYYEDQMQIINLDLHFNYHDLKSEVTNLN